MAGYLQNQAFPTGPCLTADCPALLGGAPQVPMTKAVVRGQPSLRAGPMLQCPAGEARGTFGVCPAAPEKPGEAAKGQDSRGPGRTCLFSIQTPFLIFEL